MENSKGKKSLITLSLMVVWVAYALSYFYLKNDNTTIIYSGYLALCGQAGLDIIAAILALWLWKKSTAQFKIVYLMFAVSFICAFISDGLYNIILNVLQISNLTGSLDSYFDIPFAAFLLFQMLAWGAVFFLNTEKDIKTKVIYMPYVIASLFIFLIFVFGITWKIEYFSVIGTYQILDTVLEVVGFAFASFCLARSKSLIVKYLAIGYLIIVASDLIIRYSFIQRSIVQSNPLEATWVLGLSLMIVGFFLYIRKIAITRFPSQK